MTQSKEQANSNEGADPTNGLNQQDAGERTDADAIDKDDPHKVEKLSKLGHAGDDAAGGT